MNWPVNRSRHSCSQRSLAETQNIPGAVIMPATTLPPLTSGRFLTGPELGHGGIGIVFDAVDEELARPVAVKRLRPDRADDAVARERFQREAAVTGRLDHPGVVPVYGCGADAEGRPYYAMRRIPGRTLRQALDRYFADPRPGSPSFAGCWGSSSRSARPWPMPTVRASSIAT